MFMFANNALLGGGVKVRVWIREQRKIERELLCKLLMTNLDITQTQDFPLRLACNDSCGRRLGMRLGVAHSTDMCIIVAQVEKKPR